MNTNENILCIYHSHCMDGFTAAWVVRKALGESVEFHAATHGDPPPDVTGKNVIIVDFSYNLETLMYLAKQAQSILVLDHHKSAEAALAAKGYDDKGVPIIRMDGWSEKINWDRYRFNLKQNDYENAGRMVYALFDMERSGAGIAWDFFMEEPRVAFIDHVEDRDLWRFKLEDTRNICAAIFSYDYAFANWDELDHRFAIYPQNIIAEGAAIERKHHKDIAELVEKSARVMEIAGHKVPVANLPYTMGSDAGHLMCGLVYDAEDPDTKPAFAAYYWDGPGFRNFGLRSIEGGADVSEVAKLYGGGGHRHAAGFRVPFGHELTL
jgi:uncharacterized protein